MLLGHFEAGWIGREARWKIPSLPIAQFSFAQPMWLGAEPIDGKSNFPDHEILRTADDRDIDPLEDIHASSKYRRDLVRAMVGRALTQACAR